MVFSVISDWCIKKQYIGLTRSRKLYTTLAFTFPGIFLVLASYGGCNRVAAVALFTIAMAFMGAYYSGDFPLFFVGFIFIYLFLRNESERVGFKSKFCGELNVIFKHRKIIIS